MWSSGRSDPQAQTPHKPAVIDEVPSKHPHSHYIEANSPSERTLSQSNGGQTVGGQSTLDVDAGSVPEAAIDPLKTCPSGAAGTAPALATVRERPSQEPGCVKPQTGSVTAAKSLTAGKQQEDVPGEPVKPDSHQDQDGSASVHQKYEQDSSKGNSMLEHDPWPAERKLLDSPEPGQFVPSGSPLNAPPDIRKSDRVAFSPREMGSQLTEDLQLEKSQLKRPSLEHKDLKADPADSSSLQLVETLKAGAGPLGFHERAQAADTCAQAPLPLPVDGQQDGVSRPQPHNDEQQLDSPSKALLRQAARESFLTAVGLRQIEQSIQARDVLGRDSDAHECSEEHVLDASSCGQVCEQNASPTMGGCIPSIIPDSDDEAM